MPETTAQPPAPPGGLSRLQVRRALRLWTVEGAYATIQITLTSGAFQTGFALALGCRDFTIGILAAIPAFANLLQLVSSYYAQRYGQRRLLVSWFSLASRLLWIPMLLIPFWLPRSLWIGTFLFLTLLSSALISVSNPLWMAWISDLVPEDNRGRFFGRRNMYAGLVGMLTAIAGGAFLDMATKRHALPEFAAFGVLFGCGTLFGLGSFACAIKSPDVPGTAGGPDSADEAGDTGGALAYLAAPFAHANFRRFMIFFAVFVIGQTIAAQFFTVYQLKYLGLSYTAFQSLAAVASLTSLAAMPLWGYLADKYGNKPLLMISCALVVLPPFLWIAATPDGIPGLWSVTAGTVHLSYTKIIIIVLNVIAGVGWAGVALTQFNLMVGISPGEQRTVFVSAISAMTGITGALAPLLGGFLMEALAPVTFPRHGLLRSNYHVLFVLSALLRAGAMLLLRPVQESGSNTARYVLGQLKATKPLGSFASLQKLSRGSSAQVRQQAAGELARLKTPVAVEELVEALNDVALPVREQAAHALGEIGDARAVTPLVQKLTDPASGITGAAATALGKIGDQAALPSLAAAAQLGPAPRQLAAVEALGRLSDPRVSGVLRALIDSPDLSVRTAAIRALGEREDPGSAPALIERLRQERDPSALASLADALGRLDDRAAVGPLLEALDRSPSPIVQGELLNAVGSLTGGRDSFYPYLALERDARDEMVSKILINLQRRFRTLARGGQPRAARLAVRVGQALRAFAEGDRAAAVRRLAQLEREMERVFPLLSLPTAPAAREAVRALAARAAPGAGEVILAVFLVHLLAAGARERSRAPADGATRTEEP